MALMMDEIQRCLVETYVALASWRKTAQLGLSVLHQQYFPNLARVSFAAAMLLERAT